MAVRIGKVEIKATQRLVATEERRKTIAGAPGQKGAVAQDLGTRPAIIELEGLLFGDSALGDLETLRTAWQGGEPLSFASDIVSGTTITEVVIEDLKVEQHAGTKDTWRAVLKLREHTEPPEKAGLSTDGVNKGILADAGKWMLLAQAIMRVIKDPSCLMDELLALPDLLDALGMGDLADSILDNLAELLPEDLAGIVRAIANVDPALVVDLVEAIKEADSLEDFLAQGGLGTLGALGGALGLEEASALLGQGNDVVEASLAVLNNPELFADLDEIVASARRIGATLVKPEKLLPGGLV